uniref:Uncharacterized protein n=1 Tax=Oryza punctata TaxID=4537 RepID=A0A0E0LGJ8_ORYPU
MAGTSRPKLGRRQPGSSETWWMKPSSVGARRWWNARWRRRKLGSERRRRQGLQTAEARTAHEVLSGGREAEEDLFHDVVRQLRRRHACRRGVNSMRGEHGSCRHDPLLVVAAHVDNHEGPPWQSQHSTAAVECVSGSRGHRTSPLMRDRPARGGAGSPPRTPAPPPCRSLSPARSEAKTTVHVIAGMAILFYFGSLIGWQLINSLW